MLGAGTRRFAARTLLDLPAGLPVQGLGIAFVVGVIVFCFRFVIAIVPAVRGGYQELYRVYCPDHGREPVRHLRLSPLSFRQHNEIWILFAYLYAPIILLLLTDIALIFAARPYLAAGTWNFTGTLRKFLPNSMNAVLKQVSFFLMTSGATIVVLHVLGIRHVVAFAR